MNSNHCSIRIEPENGKHYPAYVFLFDFSGSCWRAQISCWTDSSTQEQETHTLVIGQSLPLGKIWFQLDPVGPGCLASGEFPGVSIDERDLQWAAHWALAAIKHKISENNLK